MAEKTPIQLARKYAEYSLLERVKPENKNNGNLKTRISAIRAGNGDNFVEVRAVLLFIEEVHNRGR